MRIGSMNANHGAAAQSAASGTGAGQDSISKNLKHQIDQAQKRLQDLSANTEMPPEAKMKKRQEIMKEISDLQNQLRQHEIDLRRQEQQEKENNKKEQLEAGKQRQAENSQGSSGFSGKSMQALLSADNSMAQAKVQGSVKTDMKGRAGVLEAEIQQDGKRGVDTSAKEEELADIERKASDAGNAQLSTLADADKDLREVSKGEAKEQHSAEKETVSEENGQNEKVPDGKVRDEKEKGKEDEEEQKEKNAGNTDIPTYYRPVDIRL